MPEVGPCFSYPTEGGNRDAVSAGLRRMPVTSSCFRYPPNAPSALSSVRRMPTSSACFSYPSGLRQMPANSTCFRY
jgi:hypothetical protein